MATTPQAVPSTLESILQAAGVAAVLVGPFIEMVKKWVDGLRSLGMNDAEIMAHIAEGESGLPELYARVAAYRPKLHPDDKD